MNKDINVVELMEEFFRLMVRKNRPKSNLIKMVRELDIPPIDPNRDLIKEYHEAWAAKHGFKDISGREHNS